MQKASLAGLLSLVVILLGIAPEAQAGKSYSSGSSGSSSKPAGSSYSTSKPASNSRPAYSSSNSNSKPVGSSYSTSKPAAPPSPSGTGGAGKSYSSGGSASVAPANNSNNSTSRKPSESTFNSGLSKSGASAESKSKYESDNPPPKRYEASVAPKPTYKTSGPGGVEKPIPANSPEVTSVRKYVTHERYVTYDNRSSVFYGGFYSQPIYYHDSFSPFLMGWMFSEAMNSHQRAVWAYNHSLDLDRDNARYVEMLRRDARLQAEIDALKAQNAPRDASYVPPQMADNPDIMYDKPFIDGAYNPVEVDDDSPGVGHAVGRVFTWVFFIVVGLAIVCLFVYYVFMKDYR